MNSNLNRLILAVIAGAALAISSGTLVALMTRLHWDLWQALLIPITVDVLAAYGVSEWLNGKRGSSPARLGRRVAIACLIVSISGNAIEHVMASPDGYGWAVLALGWGCLPPVAFFVAVHMYATTKGTIGPKRSAPVEPTPKTGDPGASPSRPGPGSLHSVPTTKAPKVSDEEIVAWIRAQAEPVSKRALQARFPVGSTRALKLLKQAA